MGSFAAQGAGESTKGNPFLTVHDQLLSSSMKVEILHAGTFNFQSQEMDHALRAAILRFV